MDNEHKHENEYEHEHIRKKNDIEYQYPPILGSPNIGKDLNIDIVSNPVSEKETLHGRIFFPYRIKTLSLRCRMS